MICSDVVDNIAFVGEYSAVFDPLDGSTNVDGGLLTGSIFAVYKNGPTQLSMIDTALATVCTLLAARLSYR